MADPGVGQNGNGRQFLGVGFKAEVSLSTLISLVVIIVGGAATIQQIRDGQHEVEQAIHEMRADMNATTARLDANIRDVNQRVDMIVTGRRTP